MVIFLTSSFIEYQPKCEYTAKPIDSSNGFTDNLRKYWVDNAKLLVFSSDPADYNMTDHVVTELGDSFTLSGFSVGEIRCFDNRTIDSYRQKVSCQDTGICNALKKDDCPGVDKIAHMALREAMAWADVIFLAGGHAPTENCFMKKCDLKSAIHDSELFDGVVLGLSAGSMNMAENVYLMPELTGESLDENFVRFTNGLGLTDINIVPHLQYESKQMLDGKKLIDEIVAEDSFERKFYMINDGGYFIIRNGVIEFFGDGLIMENGVTRPFYSGIVNPDNSKLFESISSVYYDLTFEIDIESGGLTFYQISEFMLTHGIVPVHIDGFDDLVMQFSEKLVVEEEKEPLLSQMSLNVIIDELKNRGSYVRTVHIHSDDGIRAENFRVNTIDGNPNRILMSLMDISLILDHDWMTDEYSRSGFLTRAEKLLRRPEYQEGYSIVYTNIKGFKAINDLLGAQSGDMVIFMERDLLVRELSPILIARLESDHFALITKTENITEVTMDRLCNQVYCEDTKCMPILIRCGVCIIDNNELNVQFMLDRAKLAENTLSAEHGLPYAFCDENLRNDYVNQRVFVSELDSAIEKGEFIPYYQPVVDIYTGEIVSAEALIRWKHSERGMILPYKFIPVFEREGLITKLDSLMVDSVLKFNLERMARGEHTVPCAVNLSRIDFYDTSILKTIKERLGKLKNVENMLKLEVTESAYAVLESDALKFLAEMKQLGISLMLDDFGSGMSSLSTLESFEFDVIKLDKGFIDQIGRNAKSEAIIRHTIGLSHDIGAKVVAEGVENKEQIDFLISAGCDMVQGYYFYKPMPEEEFEKLL